MAERAEAEAENWFKSNDLVTNKTKTCKMIFSLRNIFGFEESINSVKFLGVHLDPDLTCDQHVNFLCKK